MKQGVTLIIRTNNHTRFNLVDFKKMLGEKPKIKELDPLEIFNRLDKENEKGFLRPHQERILSQWNEEFLDRKDTIVKLHTGQGKTLVGLLMLQSSIHAKLGPAIYLCPNKYLVRQTIEEAKSFGIPVVEFSSSGGTPLAFSNGEAILVTTCQKMFNGKSVFGVIGSDRDPIKIGSIVMDDAHKCLDIIRETFSIKISKKQDGENNPVYQKLWNLFEEALMRQEPGTCIDIKENSDAHMVVPFWNWIEKINDVLDILHENKDKEGLLFSWDLIKNELSYSNCIFSGKELEISPRLIPIKMIPSFSKAKRRIFLSATLTEDSFLIRDLGIDSVSIEKPLTLEDVTYSGERMILIPTLVNSSFSREKIIEWVSRYSEKHGDFGVIALVPSSKHAEDWKSEGGIITNKDNLEKTITELKELIEKVTARHPTVLVNRYDGVDLPDNVCRILCLDSIPTHASLNDKYAQAVRPDSRIIRRQLAQRIEQGIGRGIRGPSDWCVVIATGNKLTSFLSETAKSEFLSNETKEQIKIAKDLSDEMKGEEGHKLNVLEKVIDQCITRDEGWKEFYHDSMKKIKRTPSNEKFLDIFKIEREAEIHFQNRQFQKAADAIREILNISTDDSGWYFQLIATYLYPLDKADSMNMQLKAFNENNRLHKPDEGITYSKLTNISDSREKSILEWINLHRTSTDLILKVMTVLGNIAFGVPSESFEDGVEELGKILGFASQRPEKMSRIGPDNFWNISGKQYWIISCKNRLQSDRDFISKSEAGQLSNDIAWFSQEYFDCTAKPIFIHPANTLNTDAFLDTQSYVITPEKLETLKQNVKSFYNSLTNIEKDALSTEIIKQKLAEYHLDIFHINQDYFEIIPIRQ